MHKFIEPVNFKNRLIRRNTVPFPSLIVINSEFIPVIPVLGLIATLCFNQRSGTQT